jgi:hypothetical protein
VDAKGRLVFRASRIPQLPPSASAPGMGISDSIAIVRADLDARRADTIARYAKPLMRITTEPSSDGSSAVVYASDPLQPADEWAVLSTGAIAIVRGHDYHVDWIQPDGVVSATAKLPFDWVHFTDENKQRLADSVRTAQSSLLSLGYPDAEVRLRYSVPCETGSPGEGGGGRGGGRSGGGGGGSDTPPPGGRNSCMSMTTGAGIGGLPPLPALVDLLRASPVADYEPPVRIGGVLPDRDGNLWLLPPRSKFSRKGELVYDIVNAKGVLFQRVRLPLGRSIAGFGKGGVVFLTTGDMTSGYTLERATLGSGPKK